MWTAAGLCAAAVVVLCTYWIHRWRNPKCGGRLPPGSMGLPLIGETIQLLIPSYSLDLPPFIRKRVERYGPIFRTSLLGRPAVVTVDPEINNLIIQQEGKSVELWYMDSISKTFQQEGENRTTAGGIIHKYLRSITLNHFGSESIRERLLSEIEDVCNRALCSWSAQPSVEMQRASSILLYDFNAKQMFGYDADKSPERLSEKLFGLTEGFMSLPINFPGTTHHKCVKDQRSLVKFLKGILKERLDSPQRDRKDFLDQAADDIGSEKFLTEDFVVQLLFGILFATGSIAGAVTILFKLLAENPSVVRELTDEHEAILKRRENPASLTWDEYKSMTYTVHVINEALRLSNAMPFLMRRAVKDFQVKGYTVPAGWAILVVNSALHFNPQKYKDPMKFNPSRWKEIDPYAVSKNLMPFGGGTRQCAGAEYSRVFLAILLHVLVTKYRWTKVKGGEVSRTPILKFGKGIHVKFEKLRS